MTTNGSSLLVMAWRNLWRNQRRTFLTLSSIVFGVFLAVLLTALQDRNWADMIGVAARLGGGHVTLQHPEYLDSPTLTRTVDGTEELARMAVDEEDVTRAVRRITGFNMLNTAAESYGAAFIAIDPQDEDADTLSLLEAVVEGEMFATSRGAVGRSWRLPRSEKRARVSSRYCPRRTRGRFASGPCSPSGAWCRVTSQ